jgi:hypothetical protein
MGKGKWERGYDGGEGSSAGEIGDCCFFTPGNAIPGTLILLSPKKLPIIFLGKLDCFIVFLISKSRGGRVVSRGGWERLGGCEFVTESYQDFKLGLAAGP